MNAPETEVSMLPHDAQDEYKMLIFKAAVGLLEDRSLDKLHVKDICAAAYLSRSTFYECFRNKYEIFEWHLDRSASIGSHLVGRKYTFREGHLITTKELGRYSNAYPKVEHYGNADGLLLFGRERMKKAMVSTVQVYKRMDMTERLLFQINAYSSSHVDAIGRWMASGMSMPIDELVENLELIVPSELLAILNDVP